MMSSLYSSVLLVIVGGGRKVFHSFLDLWQPVVSILIDVEAELPDPHTLPPNVRLLPLAKDRSVRSLIESGPPDVQELSKHVASTAGSNGMAQGRGLGNLAFRQLLESDAFHETRKTLVDEIIIQTKGRPGSTLIVCEHGSDGGVGPDAAIVVEDLAQYIYAALRVPVHIHENVNGCLVHTGLGDRLAKNTVTSTLDRAFQIAESKGPANITRSMSLVEYVPSRNNRTQSDHHIALDGQAVASIGYQAWLQQTSPNSALASPFASIQSRRVSYSHTLSFNIIANEVSQSLTRDLEKVLSRPKPDQVASVAVTFRDDHQSLQRQPLEAIADLAHQASADEALSAVTDLGEEIEVTTFVSINGEHPVKVVDAPIHYAKAPASPQHAIDQQCQQLTVLEALESESDQLEDQYAETELRLGKARRRFRRAYRPLRTAALAGHAVSTRKYKACLVAAQSLRDYSDRLQRLNAKLDSLAGAHSAVLKEYEHLRAHVRRIIDTLHSLRPNAISERTEPHVIAKPLTELWRNVWTLPDLPRDKQDLFIAKAVNKVTLLGLAKVLGISSPRLEPIANQIALGEYPVVGPHWGGKHGTPGEILFALPPLAEDTLESLSEMITALAPGSYVFSCDTAQCGINVLRYEIVTFMSPEELSVGLLDQARKAAFRSNTRVLYFPNATAHYDLYGLGPASNGE